MGKIRELDGLRGLLAVWVVFVHLLPSAGISPRSFGAFAPLFGEHLRVQIFCILSGFVIFLMMHRRDEGYWTFIQGRLLRIYPVYLLAFLSSVALADMALTALQEAPFSGLRMDQRVQLFKDSQAYMGQHVLVHLSLLHGVIPDFLLPNVAYAFLGQAWNISTEFQFYLVAPLLFWGLTTGSVVRRLAFATGCAGLWFALQGWQNPANLANFALYFALGIASVAFWRRDWSDRYHLGPAGVIGLALGVFGLIDMAAGLWVFVMGWLILVRDQRRGRVVLSWLTTRPMQWLGEVSYSLYLLHMIPLYLGMYLLNGAGLGRLAYLVLLAAFTFSLALPIAWFSTHYIEKPFLRVKGQSILPGRRVSQR